MSFRVSRLLRDIKPKPKPDAGLAIRQKIFFPKDGLTEDDLARIAADRIAFGLPGAI